MGQRARTTTFYVYAHERATQAGEDDLEADATAQLEVHPGRGDAVLTIVQKGHAPIPLILRGAGADVMTTVRDLMFRLRPPHSGGLSADQEHA